MAKILVVEDSETVRFFIKGIVEKAGHEVLESHDGAHALTVAKANPDIEFVITDYNMPNMDGLAFTKALKDDPHFKSIPVLMITTEGSDTLKAFGKESGVLAWLTKPVSAEKITAILGKILSKSA